MNEMVKVKCLRHIYPDKTEVKLCGLDFVVHTGEKVLILGPNGSGKTTLLAHLTGLLKAVEGEVRVLGVDPVKAFKTLRRRVGVVFQNVDEQIIGPTVWDDVAFAPRNLGLKAPVIEQMVGYILQAMNLYSLKDKVPHYLSGGEKKKVALAGAMVMRPELLIMDEPFDGLDAGAKREIIRLLWEFNREFGTTMVITNHDVNLVPLIADSVYIISNGIIQLHGTPREVFACPEVLRQANLEPPLLVELFAQLARDGLPLDIPLTPEEARRQLLQLFKPGSSRQSHMEEKKFAVGGFD